MVCPGRESHVNIQAAPPPEEVRPQSWAGAGARAAGGAWQSAPQQLPLCLAGLSAVLSCVHLFAAEPQEHAPRWRPFRASHRGNDNHEVGRDVGDAGKEVRGQPGEVALRELTGWEDLQHIGRLEKE